MRFIDTGIPWTYSTTSAGTCSFTLTNSENAYLIQGVIAYGGTLSNATLSIQCSGGVALFTGYLGSAGPIPTLYKMNLDITKRATLSVSVNAAGTGALTVYGWQVPTI